jgi:hypothetical protein
VNLVSLQAQIVHEIHPEIVDIPGSVQNYSNSHWALVMRICEVL